MSPHSPTGQSIPQRNLGNEQLKPKLKAHISPPQEFLKVEALGKEGSSAETTGEMDRKDKMDQEPICGLSVVSKKHFLQCENHIHTTGTHRKLQEPASSVSVITPPKSNSFQHWKL